MRISESPEASVGSSTPAGFMKPFGAEGGARRSAPTLDGSKRDCLADLEGSLSFFALGERTELREVNLVDLTTGATAGLGSGSSD